MSDRDKAYIAVRPCGCVTACMVAGYDTAAGDKRELRSWIRSGRRVEITTVADARERLTMDCPHPKAQTEDEIDALVAEGRSA